MQRLWSRAAPAQSSCRCISCLSTGASGITSRAASAASKRRLRIGNSVTALYTSIFAAAALADAQAKDQRRLEWKEKIAAVKEEVNELVDEEQRIVATIMARRNKKKLFLGGGTVQTRQYSTGTGEAPSRNERFQRPAKHTAPPKRSEIIERLSHRSSLSNTVISDGTDDLMDELDVDRSVMNAATIEPDDRTVKEIEEMEDEYLEEYEGDYDLGLEDDIMPEWLATDMVRLKCIRKLAMKQLSIRFLLRPVLAHSYMGLRMRYDFDYSIPRVNVRHLLDELNGIRKRIRELKMNPYASIADLEVGIKDVTTKELTRQRRVGRELDQAVLQDTEAYLTGHMSLPELLLRLSNNMLQSVDPDRPLAIRAMISTFGKARQNDLGDLVLKAVLPNKFPLNSTTILSILHFFRKTKNLKGFDMFLEMIRGDLYPVDLQNLGFYRREVVNGIVISVPPVHAASAIIWSTLITCCLRFDQPQRADAYLQTARKYGYMDDFSTLNGYLKFFTIRKDWEGGLQTIQRSLAFLASSAQHPEGRVHRLIARMVLLCDQCRKHHMSNALITAAMNSGFKPNMVEEQLDLEFAADPTHRRWVRAYKKAPAKNRGKLPWEKVYIFVDAMREHLDIDSLSDERSAGKWDKLMEIYSQQVLSSVHSNVSDEYKTTYQDLQHESSKKLLRAVEVRDGALASQQQEIKSLKDEVAQLKQMVFELAATASPANEPPVARPSPNNDLGELKEKLSATSRPVRDEAPQQKSIHYRSAGNAS